MRIVETELIKKAVKEAVKTANTRLPVDVLTSLEKARDNETVPHARQVLDILLQNAHQAQTENMPLCQDTGLVTVHATRTRSSVNRGQLI